MDEAESYSARVAQKTAAWREAHGGAEPTDSAARAIRRDAFDEVRHQPRGKRAARPPLLRPRLLAAALGVAIIGGAAVALTFKPHPPVPAPPKPLLVRGGAGVSTTPLATKCPDGHADLAFQYSFRVTPASVYGGQAAVIRVHGNGGGWAGYDRQVSVRVAADGSFGFTLPSECRVGGQVEVSPISVGGRAPGVT